VFIRKSANGQVCYAQTKHKETIQKKNSNKNGQEDNLVEISKKSLEFINMVESINCSIHAILNSLIK
jgi:hypothetical protein